MAIALTDLETPHQDLLSLKWPSPPRNLLLLKKKHAPVVDDAFTGLIKHIRQTYPGISVIVEKCVAEETQSQVKGPIYSLPADTRNGVQAASKVDMTTTLGGDGTILHAASLFSNAMTVPPILSFSMGTLGFLGEWRFHEYKRALRDVYVSGATSSYEEPIPDKPPSQATQNSDDHQAVRPSSWSTVRGKSMGQGRNARVLLRNRLDVKVSFPDSTTKQPNGNFKRFAMNEVIIHRGSDPHLAILDVFVGGRFLTEAVADGMIISTPTGSTAYSLSSGGSIVHPLVPSLLLTPICPRSLSFRPLVLPANTPITLRLSEKNRGRNVDVSIDGVKMEEGFSVGMQISVRAEEVKDAQGSWIGGVPSIVRAFPGVDAGSEDSWVGGLNGLLKFNYPMGEA